MAPKNSDRQLLERSGKVRLWAVSEGRRTRYEIESELGKWSFGTLFMAIGKFDRLARERRTAQP